MKNSAHVRALGAVAAAVLLGTLTLVGGAAADNEVGSLPGGTSIEVAIVNPAHNSVVNGPAVPVDGTAAVGQGVPVPNTALIYVIDVSNSTSALDGCGGDQNADGFVDSRLDCEIAAVKALNQTAAVNGTVLDVGLVVFGTSAAAADVGPAAGEQGLTGPATDAGGAAGSDLAEAVASASFGGIGAFTAKVVGGGSTNFAAAMDAANTLAATSAATTKLVVMMSDGFANAGGPVGTQIANANTAGIDYHTFAVGVAANCTTQGQGSPSSLDDIALGTGGTCTEVDDLSDLPNVVPGVIASRLTALAMSVDTTINNAPDSPFSPIGNADITPDLPQIGPANVVYATTTAALSPGLYEICVRATGSDGGGVGSVTDCHVVRVNAPPECGNLIASPRLLWPPNHKLRQVTVTGATDPDGDPLTTTIVSVTQDEPVDGLGDGDTAPDAVLGPASNQVKLRAERSGLGDGRVYRLLVLVEDEFGLTCRAFVRVGVPHDQGAGSVPIDSAPPSYNSLVP